MTIAAAYLTSEGVVFGADSKTTFQTSAGVLQLLDHAQKIYEIGESSNLALCTWGAGKVGDLSHRTIAALVADRLVVTQATTDNAIKQLVDILESKAKAKELPAGFQVGYFVGGVDPGDRVPRCARIVCHVTQDNTGTLTYSITKELLPLGQARFDGAPEYFTRVFHGCAPGLPEAICAKLKGLLPTPITDFEALFKNAYDQVRPQFVSAGVTDLPLREAIDFVHTFLQVTIKAFKFRIGPPPCGGPVEIGFVSTDRPFRWARHKEFDSAIRDIEAKHGIAR